MEVSDYYKNFTLKYLDYKTWRDVAIKVSTAGRLREC
jgi:hypothetical protein